MTGLNVSSHVLAGVGRDEEQNAAYLLSANLKFLHFEIKYIE